MLTVNYTHTQSFTLKIRAFLTYLYVCDINGVNHCACPVWITLQFVHSLGDKFSQICSAIFY